jgi:hypothetical protein
MNSKQCKEERTMKKVSLAMMILAGLSLLVALAIKLGGMTHGIMGTVPSSYLEMTKIFLLAAIAFGVCGHDCCKKG